MMLRMQVVLQTYVLLLFGSEFSGAEFPPLIAHPNPAWRDDFFILASAHKSFALECVVDQPDGNRTIISWRQNKRTPLPVGWLPADMSDFAPPPPGPFQARHIKLPYFRLSNSSLLYEGTYECTASNTAGTAVSGPVTVKFADVKNTRQSTPRHITAQVGQTLVLPCSSTNLPLDIHPGHKEVGFSVKWMKQTQVTTRSDVDDSVFLMHDKDRRVAINDVGTLYIRNVSLSDKTRPDQLYLCTIVSELGTQVGGKMTGLYTLDVIQPPMKPTSPKLLYKSPDTTLFVGTTVFLACIFEDNDGPPLNVSWRGPVAPSMTINSGTLISITGVSAMSAGQYQCTYPAPGSPVSASIYLTVKEYPGAVSINDTVTPLGQSVSIACSAAGHAAERYHWSFNDGPVENKRNFKVQGDLVNSILNVNNPQLSDTGVVGCSAVKNDLTMKKSARLVVYAIPSIEVSQSQNVNGTEVADGRAMLMAFRCQYKVDFRATDVYVYFTMSKRTGPIDDRTQDDLFGIERPAVIVTKQGVVWLKILYNPNLADNFVGKCSCHVSYNILSEKLSIKDTTGITINFKISQTLLGSIELWMIVVAIIALLIIIVAIGAVSFHVIRTTATAAAIEYDVHPQEIIAQASAHTITGSQGIARTTPSAFAMPPYDPGYGPGYVVQPQRSRETYSFHQS